MAKNRAAKAPAKAPANKKHKRSNPKSGSQPKQKKPKIKRNPSPNTPESDSDIPSSPTRIHSLLEPYSKDQLISFLIDASESDPSLRARIQTAADKDISHRKIFVHGLGWDTTTENLLEAMAPFGPIEECKVVVDRITGRAKGFAFVIFKTRTAAIKALKEPQIRIKNRLASCQLASVGPVANPDFTGPAGGPSAPVSDGRRIYVGKVQPDAVPDKLKELFSKFGEIEAGPIGFDMLTGKSRGYAIFVYKNQEGAKKALEEPHKLFEGQQLYCQMYTPSNKAKQPLASAGVSLAAAVPPHQQQQLQASPALLGSAPQQVLAAMAAAQNLALLGYNPAYSMLLAQNPLLAAAAMNPAAVMQGYGGGAGMGSAGTGGASVLGPYGQGTYAGLQGMQGFPGSSLQGGQKSDGKADGSFGGFPPSYM